MFDRNLKEYTDYLGQELRNDQEITNSIYKAALKALTLKEFIFLNEQDKKAVIIPSVNSNEHIMITDVEGELNIYYEKTKAISEKVPFRNAVTSLLSGKTDLYGMHTLFKFTTKEMSGLNLMLKEMEEGFSKEFVKIMNDPEKVKNYSRPAGKCLLAFAALDSLKVLSDTFNGLGIMNKLSNNSFVNLGSVAAKKLQPDVKQFIEDFNYLYTQAIENKNTTKNPYTFHNDKIWTPTLANTVCFQSQGIGYVVHGDGENNWSLYPYSKEYSLNTTVKEIISKIKDQTINDTLDCTLKIENGKITHLGSLLYDMAIELYNCVREYKELEEDKKVVKVKRKI